MPSIQSCITYIVAMMLSVNIFTGTEIGKGKPVLAAKIDLGTSFGGGLIFHYSLNSKS